MVIEPTIQGKSEAEKYARYAGSMCARDNVAGIAYHCGMPAKIQFTSIARINSLYWITFLRDEEVGVTRRVLDDLEPVCASQNLPFKHFVPTTASELIDVLDAIAGEARRGMLPIIHFDTHGSAEDGILIVQTGEFVGWEVVAEKLRAINVVTGNNLCVVSGACFSFNVIRQVDIHKVAPFFILLAPEHEILAGDIEASIIGFYRDMLAKEDIIEARSRWFPTTMRMFHCEEMLAVVLSKYINNAGLGKQRERRKEQLVTDALDSGVPRNRKNLRTLRKRADDMITPDEKLIQRFIPVFLGGKRPAFTVKQLKTMVIDARAEGLKPEGPYTS